MKAHKIAVDIVQNLQAHGHIAYFAGGWVRDHVMGNDASDIDIATDATPEKIIKLFPKTLLIGISFGVVVVIIDGHHFEVATFREDSENSDGRKPESVLFSTPKEDALRRDFTINGLFYNPITHEILDYVDGVKDIKKRVIRTIGDPQERFVEDRLRMVRAFRFASRFDFSIDQETQDAIFENADTLFPSVSIERIWQELNKMSKHPRFDKALIEMHRLELLPIIFPELKGTHLHDIKQRVLYFNLFPKKTHTILYLAQLFPDISKDEMIDICRYLRVSNHEIYHIETYYLAKALVKKEIELNEEFDPVEWTHYFARKDAFLSLEILMITSIHEQKESHLITYKERVQKLKKHIDRIVNKTPIISGKDLLSLGFKPGEFLGKILNEAERYSIIKNIEDSELILDYLKKTPLWQNNFL